MIRRHITIPASPPRLWEALTDPGQTRDWFGGRLELDLREGAPLRFTDDDGSIREGRVEAVRPERHLRFRWWPSGADEDHDDASEVTYLLEADGDGTRFTVQERRLRSGQTAGRLSAGGWTAWDGRLAGAWAGVVSVPGARV